jgi:hypothetical protein
MHRENVHVFGSYVYHYLQKEYVLKGSIISSVHFKGLSLVFLLGRLLEENICLLISGIYSLCVDPGEKEAILEAGGPGPPGGGKGGQSSDSGGG